MPPMDQPLKTAHRPLLAAQARPTVVAQQVVVKWGVANQVIAQPWAQALRMAAQQPMLPMARTVVQYLPNQAQQIKALLKVTGRMLVRPNAVWAVRIATRPQPAAILRANKSF